MIIHNFKISQNYEKITPVELFSTSSYAGALHSENVLEDGSSEVIPRFAMTEGHYQIRKPIITDEFKEYIENKYNCIFELRVIEDDFDYILRVNDCMFDTTSDASAELIAKHIRIRI